MITAGLDRDWSLGNYFLSKGGDKMENKTIDPQLLPTVAAIAEVDTVDSIQLFRRADGWKLYVERKGEKVLIDSVSFHKLLNEATVDVLERATSPA